MLFASAARLERAVRVQQTYIARFLGLVAFRSPTRWYEDAAEASRPVERGGNSTSSMRLIEYGRQAGSRFAVDASLPSVKTSIIEADIVLEKISKDFRLQSPCLWSGFAAN